MMKKIKKSIIFCIRKKFFKIKNMPYLIKYVNFEYSFKKGIEFLNIALELSPTIEDKIIAIDYIINTLKKDIQVDLLSNIIYRNEGMVDKIVPFPMLYYDEDGIKHEISVQDNVYKEIDFEKDIVISTPWKKERIFNNLKNIHKNGFIYHQLNHKASYYTDVDMCFITNGYHSCSIGIHNRKGKIRAKEIDISPLFEHIYSDDGLYWYDQNTDNKISDVQDFRLALIFEMTKAKIKLIQKNKQEQLQ